MKEAVHWIFVSFGRSDCEYGESSAKLFTENPKDSSSEQFKM